MTPIAQFSDQWPVLSALLDEALSLSAADQPVWLAGLTGDRAAHRDALMMLLAHRAEIETDDFLADGPKLSPGAEGPGAGPAEGTRVGAYRLISEIGRGGMSTVWLAERSDGMMKRRVALKPPRAVWGDAFAERLAREREILAGLEHEHIARLYDAGVDAQGRPFLAMEFVEGESIDAYCLSRSLPLRERVALLLQVTAAVAYAHTRLVVHRDLKPGNILVTNDAQVKLLDFGIAKLLEGDRTHGTALTELTGRALTPDYASPEQIKGEALGTASDVYSLGVVAYEVLTDSRPYRLKRGSPAEIEEAIANAEPLRASEAAPDLRRRKQLRGDLDAILNKALKKSVVERYQSVDLLAQDLGRFLRGQPVLAQPDSRRYRMGKFARRHRFAIAMSTALGASMVGGVGISVWQAREARQQAARAEAEVDAQVAVRDLYRETLMELSVTAAKEPAALAPRHAVVATLQRKFAEMGSRYTGRPTARDAQLDAVAVQLNFDGDAEGSLAVARELLDSLKEHHARTERILRAYSYVSRALFVLKRFDESEQVRRAALAWAPDDVDPITVATRSVAYKDLASLLITRGKRAEAEQVLKEGDALMDRTFPDGEFTYVPLQLSSLYIGFDEAQALKFARKGHKGALATPQADPEQLAFDWFTLGSALSENGLASEAEVALRKSHEMYLSLLAPDNGGVVRVFNRLVGAVSRQGDYARAASLLAEERRTLAALPGGISRSADNYLQARAAESAWLAGDVSQASRFTSPPTDALFVGSVRSDNDSPLLASAQLLCLAGRAGEALAVLKDMEQHWPNPGQPTALWVRLQQAISIAQLDAGDVSGAGATSRALRALLEGERASAGRAYRAAAEIEAVAAARQHDLAGAAQALARADGAKPAPPFMSVVERAESMLRRGEVFAALGRVKDAAAAGRSALADLSTQHPESPRLAQARRLVGLAGATP